MMVQKIMTLKWLNLISIWFLIWQLSFVLLIKRTSNKRSYNTKACNDKTQLWCETDCRGLDAQVLSSSAGGPTTWRLQQRVRVSGRRPDDSVVPSIRLHLHHRHRLPEPTGTTTHIAISHRLYEQGRHLGSAGDHNNCEVKKLHNSRKVQNGNAGCKNRHNSVISVLPHTKPQWIDWNNWNNCL